LSRVYQKEGKKDKQWGEKRGKTRGKKMRFESKNTRGKEGVTKKAFFKWERE
jgi:hypothetical protein